MKKILAVLAVSGLAASANAQLLVGHDDAAPNDNAWNVNPNTGSSSLLWSGAEVWGMAYDGGTNTVFANDGTTLRSGLLGAGAPTNEVTTTDAAGALISFVGLAFANGDLYGTRNVGDEAIYRINTTSGVATVVLDYAESDYDVGGLAFNPADGLFYGTNDDTTPGSGLYSFDVFGSGAINLVTPYPAGETDIDGLAVGNGVAYLVEDEAGNTIHPYDLGSGTYLPSLLSPMTSSEIFSGAAWVPAPTSITLLGLGSLAATRRRR